MCKSRGRGVGGPDPIPGKSQVQSNSIEISIWTPPPLVNSWTPPLIPGKFWTKKPKTSIKKSRLFSRRWAWTPPPPSLTKKSGSAHALTIQPLTPGLIPCQKELYGYVCTLAELYTNHRGPRGGGGGGGGGG